MHVEWLVESVRCDVVCVVHAAWVCAVCGGVWGPVVGVSGVRMKK